MSKSTILTAAATVATIIATSCSAFTVPSSPAHPAAAMSGASAVSRQAPVLADASSLPVPLFGRTKSRDEKLSAAAAAPTRAAATKLSPLFMTTGDAAEKPAEDTEEQVKDAEIVESTSVEASASTASKTSGDEIDDGGGFFTTLLLAPPLLFKFLIVLCVKVLTDAVVYPTLFLWKVAGRAKRKVLGLFGIKSDDDDSMDEAELINGESANGDFA
mmetsp:Transcript_3531/g.7669  ORF Transcript_3531/g.7669 Transcript_3531/m.7669 type:complete len:216 (+) Transcript_3531:38-685(+)